MQDLKINIVQCEQFWEDKQRNLEHIQIKIDEIKDVDLILLPEMFHTGFSMNAKELTEKMTDSIAVDFLKKNSQKKNVAIYTSFICEENGKFFNRGIFVFPDGTYEIYDKKQLFSLAGEDKVFTAGSKKTIVQYKGWKILLQICYDLRFPEVSRNYIEKDTLTPSYDLVLYVANWPERRITHWDILVKSRAIENQCFVAVCNRVGTDGNELYYSGNSQIINPNGDVLVENKLGQETNLLLSISKSDLNAYRERFQFLKDSLYCN